jgi:integrase
MAALAQLSLCWDAKAPGLEHLGLVGERGAELALFAPSSAPNALLSADGGVVLGTHTTASTVPWARPKAQQPRTPTYLARESAATASAALQALRAAADNYAAEASTERTRMARKRDWDSFEAWCTALRLRALPADVDTVRCYLAHLVQLGRKASTIRRARCSIGLKHEQESLPRPDCTARTRQVERGIARVHGGRELGATPVLQHDLERLVQELNDSPRAVRDRAILLLGFAGAFRTSELVSLHVEDLTFKADAVIVRVRRAKEDQLAHGRATRIPRGTRPQTCPILALEQWLERVGRPASGPLFRRIDGDCVRAAAMGERAASRAVQRAVARVGLVGKYSSHSLRAGLCTSAYVAGSTLREIADHCRMDCPQTVYRYLHPELVPGRPNVAAGLV